MGNKGLEEKNTTSKKKVSNLEVNFEKFFYTGRLVLLAIGSITGLGYVATHRDEVKDYQHQISLKNREQYETTIEYDAEAKDFIITTKDGQKINVLR